MTHLNFHKLRQGHRQEWSLWLILTHHLFSCHQYCMKCAVWLLIEHRMTNSYYFFAYHGNHITSLQIIIHKRVSLKLSVVWLCIKYSTMLFRNVFPTCHIVSCHVVVLCRGTIKLQGYRIFFYFFAGVWNFCRKKSRGIGFFWIFSIYTPSGYADLIM